MRCDKQPAKLLGDLGHMMYRRMGFQVGLERGKIETEGACATGEAWMKRGEYDAVHDTADFLHTIDRFNARRAAGDEADASSRSNGGHRRVSMPLVKRLEPAASIGRKDSTFGGQLSRC